jgi:hypothetical protein
MLNNVESGAAALEAIYHFVVGHFAVHPQQRNFQWTVVNAGCTGKQTGFRGQVQGRVL